MSYDGTEIYDMSTFITTPPAPASLLATIRVPLSTEEDRRPTPRSLQMTYPERTETSPPNHPCP